MTRSTGILVFSFVALATVAPFRNVEGQPGRLADIEEKMKGAKQPVFTTVPMKDIYADPDVVPITLNQLVRFEKALRFEVSELEAVKAMKGPVLTPQQYQTCNMNAAMSPEVMKMGDDMARANANAPVEELMKAQEKVLAAIAALVLKRCGEEQQEFRRKREARAGEIPGKASDIAMPEGWAPRSPDADATSAQPPPRGPWAGENPEGDARFAAAQVPHPFLRAYAMLKERIVPYCVAFDYFGFKVVAGKGGWGVGVPSAYIYTYDEARAMESKCLQILKVTREAETEWNIYTMWGVTPQ